MGAVLVEWVGRGGGVSHSPALDAAVGQNGAIGSGSYGESDSGRDVGDNDWGGLGVGCGSVAELSVGSVSPTADGGVGKESTGVGSTGTDGDGGRDVGDWGEVLAVGIGVSELA